MGYLFKSRELKDIPGITLVYLDVQIRARDMKSYPRDSMIALVYPTGSDSVTGLGSGLALLAVKVPVIANVMVTVMATVTHHDHDRWDDH